MRKFRHEWVAIIAHNPTGWPYMRAKCCFSRVNHLAPPVKLEKPESYGAYNPETMVTATHTQEYSCKCGKTTLIVEGTLKTSLVHGCFSFEEKA